MKILSLFDGISCAMLAMDRAGIKVDNYFASEINQYAIKIALKNYPDTVQLGDVRQILGDKLPQIDLLCGGSPCQGFSFAGKQLNFYDARSKLFFEFVRLYKECKPTYFLLENVMMKQEYQDVISGILGVKPVMINSCLVSAQNRKRLYWTNIPILPLEDKGILLKDIIFDDCIPISLHEVRYNGEQNNRIYVEKSSTIKCASGGRHIPSLLTKKAIDYMNRCTKDGRNHWDFAHHSDTNNTKSSCVVANFAKGIPYNVLKTENCIRYFHPVECERLQTLPDDHTAGISSTQRYNVIGNAWTVDVVAHIFKGLRKK